MPSTTTYKQGDVVLVSFPFTDLTSAKKRPALIISPDAFNRLNQDLILVGITSQLAGDEYGFLLDEADFVAGRLPKKSMVKVTKLFTIHSALVHKKLCALRPERLAEVLQQIREFFS